MRTLRLFPRLVWFEAQRYRAYPLEALANVIERGLLTGLFILLWLSIGQHSNTPLISTRDVIGYFLIIGGLIPFLYANMAVAVFLSRMIKVGELNQLLLRPVNAIVYPWAIRTGRNVVSLLLGLLQIVAGCLVSRPELSAVEWLLLVPLALNALAVNVAFNVLLGTLAFYFIDAKGFISTFVHVARLLRGEYMPLYLLPVALQTWLEFTPFPASMSHVVLLLQGKGAPAPMHLLVASAWSVALIFWAVKLWGRGLRRYEAIGL